MNILIAVDSFKGTLTSREIAEIIKKNISKRNHTVDIIAIADGGEGTVDALMYATKGQKKNIHVQGAYGCMRESYYCLANNRKTAILEIALSSGIATLKENQLNPLKTTTYGLGESINDALNEGVDKVIVGIGGSSTNDGGAGMLKALGVQFFDIEGIEIDVLTGESIGCVETIDMSGLNPLLKKVTIDVACDVTNPLLGKQGCTYTYGPQKGANQEMLKVLESNMEHFAHVVQRELGLDYKNVPGVGAAGGLGYAFITFLNAKLQSGLEVVSLATNLRERIKAADIVITGEGSFDFQSLHGKAPVRIAKIAKAYHKKVIGLFAITSTRDMPQLFDDIISIVPTVATKEESLKKPAACLEALIKKELHI